MKSDARSYYVVGLGCPKNQVDTEVIWASLATAGLRATDDPSQAQVIVINTCAFIQDSVEESLDTIMEMSTYRREGCLQHLVVAGCLPARYQEDLAPQLEEVSLFVGPSQIDRIPELLDQVDGNQNRIVLGQGAHLPTAQTPRVNSLSPGAAYLKVAEGCSRRCSFCIIPKLRGPQRSRPIDDLVSEANNLVRLGVVELVLVAQDLAAWGQDLPGKPQLADLVSALADVGGLWWLRMMYLFPTEVPEKLLQVVAQKENILPYFDIPLQHIDAEVLGNMHRPGDPVTSRALIQRIRQHLPDAVLRTSLMTGFPGETEEAFARLEEFVQECRFERLGVFSFSAEEGTEASRLPDLVPCEIGLARKNRLMELQQPIGEAYHRTLLGKTLEVLVDSIEEEGMFSGRAWNQAPEVDGVCYVSGQATLGEVVVARLNDVDAYDLYGEIIS